jgi:predicted acyltransferase
MARPLERLASLDAYRGLIMLTLAAAGFGFPEMAKQFASDSQTWRLLAFHFDHPAWNSQYWTFGCSYWDLIQPSFMFMVGVSMPFSYLARQSRGDGYGKMMLHALCRSVVLVLLGIFLASDGRISTQWIFTNVLAQIGLGYFFVFLLMGRPTLLQLLMLVAIIVCYWTLFVFHDVPGATSFADHFQKDTNFAAGVDTLFLSKFWRGALNVPNKGGYTTLNFVPSMATMLIGVMAGELLQSSRSKWLKVAMLFGTGILCMGLGVAAAEFGLCPIVKRIWTPSWVLFSGAYTLWILGAFYLVVDVIGLKFWTFPLRVFGMNSILIYMMGQLLRGWTTRQIHVHFDPRNFYHDVPPAGVQDVFHWMSDNFLYWIQGLGASYGATLRDGDYAPLMQSLSVLLVFWLICYWLYRQRIFLRI